MSAVFSQWSSTESIFRYLFNPCLLEVANPHRVIAEWLSKLGYHLDGKMFAVVEGGMSFYTITVDGDKVTSEEFIPDATYVDEFYACEESEDT